MKNLLAPASARFRGHFKHCAAVPGAAELRRAIQVARRIEDQIARGNVSVAAGAEAMQNCFLPAAAALGQFEHSTQAGGSAGGCGAIEIPGIVENQSTQRLTCVRSAVDEVSKNVLGPPISPDKFKRSASALGAPNPGCAVKIAHVVRNQARHRRISIFGDYVKVMQN